MRGERIIGADDRGAAEAIMGRAYELLQPMYLLNLPRPGPKTPEAVYGSRVCQETSDAVTRAAHELGIMASREAHPGGKHHITSFGALDQPPAEDDPVICLTLGQFNPVGYNGLGFFGRRTELARHFESRRLYKKAFGAGSVLLREITHTTFDTPLLGHRWLRTTPADVASGAYPMGEVTPEVFEALQFGLPPHRSHQLAI